MKTSNRAVRRHHMKRLKTKRGRYNNTAASWDGDATVANIGKVYHTPCRCSCWMCGHQRFYHGLNMQEIRARAKHQE